MKSATKIMNELRKGHKIMLTHKKMPQVFTVSIQIHKICHKKSSIRVKTAKK